VWIKIFLLSLSSGSISLTVVGPVKREQELELLAVKKWLPGHGHGRSFLTSVYFSNKIKNVIRWLLILRGT
jgi:hypothetical protein